MSSDIVDISSIIGKEISVVKDPDIACTTLSIDQTIRLDGIPTPIKNQILCIKRCLDYLNLTNEMGHLDQLLLELEMSEIKDLTTFTDPCQLIKSLNTDNSFIVIDGFQESCDAYLVRGTENGEITWWVLLNSMTCNNEYIAIDSYAIDYSRLNEFDSFKHGTIACSFLINENKIFEREEHKHPIRKIQSSNVIESLEELYLEYEGKITKVNNFDALCSNSSRDDSYTVFYFKDNTCVGISTIEGFTKVYSTEPFFEFNGISLYIVKDGQKTIRNSTINKQKKVAKEAQRSIDEFCLNYTETVAKSILRDYESQISGISNNFNTPESIMKFITNMLYNKDPNETQKAFASSTVFRPSDINDPIKHRVFFLSTPPGSGKTACEIMPAVYENFKQSFKSDSEQSITIIATSLVQVSGQISSACFSLYGGNDKWLKVRRLDGGSKELLGGKQQNTIFFKPKFAKEHVLDSEAIRKRILKGFSTETLKEYMEAVFKEAKLNIDGNIFDQVLKNFTDPNSFRKNTIPFIYEGIDSKGRFNADVLVGTYEMIYSTLINTLVGNEKVDNKSAEQIANRIKYIIIDEWDTIFRPKIADKNPISEVLDQRFSHSYGIIALALLLLKKNPNCKLILASGTGSKMLKICEENILTGKSSNMLEPLLRCIPTKKELDDALKVIENESNNQLSKEKQVMFVKKSNTSSLDNAKKLLECITSNALMHSKIAPLNIWGSRKCMALSKSLMVYPMAAYAGSNMLLLNSLANNNYIKRCNVAPDLSKVSYDAVHSTIMNIACCFLCEMNVSKTLLMIANDPNLSGWGYLLSIIITYIVGGASESNEKIIILFAQLKELHIYVLILIGVLLFMLEHDGISLQRLIETRSPPSKCNLSEAISLISSKSLRKIKKSADSISKQNFYSFDNQIDDLIKVSLSSEIDHIGCAIFKDLLLKNFGIEHLWELCEKCISCGIVSVTKETVSQETMINYISHEDGNHPLIVVCTSRLGEGVDLAHAGPTFVISTQGKQEKSVTKRDCIQWLGRGYRKSNSSLCFCLNIPKEEPEKEFSSKYESEFKDSHTAIYSGFLSSRLARDMFTCLALKDVSCDSKTGDPITSTIIPKSITDAQLICVSPVILDGLIDGNGDPIISSIISTVQTRYVPLKMVIRSKKMYQLDAKHLNTIIPDIFISDTLGLSTTAWGIYCASAFSYIASRAQLPPDVDRNIFDLYDFTRNLSRMMMFMSNLKDSSIWNGIYKNLNSNNVNGCIEFFKEIPGSSSDFPSLKSLAQRKALCQFVGACIARRMGVPCLSFIFTIGCIACHIQIDSIGEIPEGFKHEDGKCPKIKKTDVFKNFDSVVNIMDLVSTLGLGFLINDDSYIPQNEVNLKCKKKKTVTIPPMYTQPLKFYLCREKNPFTMKMKAGDKPFLNPILWTEACDCFISCCNLLLKVSNKPQKIYSSKNEKSAPKYSTKMVSLYNMLYMKPQCINDPRLQIFAEGLRMIHHIRTSVEKCTSLPQRDTSPFISLIVGFSSSFSSLFDEIGDGNLFKEFYDILSSDTNSVLQVKDEDILKTL